MHYIFIFLYAFRLSFKLTKSRNDRMWSDNVTLHSVGYYKSRENSYT